MISFECKSCLAFQILTVCSALGFTQIWQLQCLLLHFGLKRYSPLFYVLGDDNIFLQVYKTVYFGYLYLMEDSCYSHKLRCSFYPFPSKPVFSRPNIRIHHKSCCRKNVVSHHFSATMLLQKKHLHSSGAVSKSHTKDTWTCLKVCNGNVPIEWAVHKGSLQLLSEHVLRTRFDGSCLQW